jgi:hypothetical protein
MRTNRRLPVIAKTPVNGRAAPDPSAWLANIGTGFGILAFGVLWFVFLRGLTALGRLLMVWHFYI